MSRLSFVINTKNCAPTLRACLGSILNVADEIVAVDMASTDGTIDIIRSYPGIKLYQYPDPEVGFADPARQFAIDKATGDWVAIIDSDEVMPPELADLMRQVADGAHPPEVAPAAAYYIARRNIIWGQELEHTAWWPDFQLRLWRAGSVTWKPIVHSRPHIDGVTSQFPAREELAFVHYNYQTVDQYLDRTQKYATLLAASRGHKKTIQAEWLWQNFWDEWWRRGLAGNCFDDGSHGIALALLQAASELQITCKMWEDQGFPAQSLDQRQIRALYRRWHAEAAFWWADYFARHRRGLAKLYWRLRRKLKI
ncbi:glycosyltransferase family 2 protein [bacterium]|nr:glycosyltransferase family 2 protein [bacterium]